MRAIPWLSACAIAGALVGGAAWAQSAASPEAAGVVPRATPAATATVTLGAALDAAWQRAVAARVTDGQRRRAEAERAAATSLWAAPPALDIVHRNDRWQTNAGERETAIGVAVPLWLPGQRAARGAVADTAMAQAEAAERAARLRLAGELRDAAWALVAVGAEAEQADAQLSVLKRLADDVERRVRAGDLARADALAAQGELLAATAQQAEVRQRGQAARTRWTLLTGLSAAPAVNGEQDMADPGLTLPSSHPELQLAAQDAAHARKRVDLVRSSRREAPDLLLGVRQDTPGHSEATSHSIVVGLRLPFGTDDRNRPLEAAALSELDVAQTREQRLREQLDGDLAAARDALRSARAQHDAESTRARLLRERANLIDRSFRAGETPLPDLLRALAMAAQAESASARQHAALGLARARLQQALGVLP